MTEHDMALSEPPERGIDPDRTCGTCAWCIEECCDYGVCAMRMPRQPGQFGGWWEALDYMDGRRVDMQADTCEDWEEHR